MECVDNRLRFKKEEREQFKTIFKCYRTETSPEELDNFISPLETVCVDSISRRPAKEGPGKLTLTDHKELLEKMKTSFSNTVGYLQKIRLGKGRGIKTFLRESYSLGLIQRLDGLPGNADICINGIVYAHKAKENLIKLIDLIDSELETTHKRKRGQRMHQQKELNRAIKHGFETLFNETPSNFFLDELEKVAGNIIKETLEL